MHLLKCTNRFDLVVNAYVTQPYHSHMSLNRIILERECTANKAFWSYFVVEPSRYRFAIDWFEMSGRRDIVKNFEKGGLQQIEPPAAKVRVSYSNMSAG